MVIEFADFFALLQPASNISNVGRVPQKLEAFRISLPCSGRITTEVPVIIRFTFNVRHPKHNITMINVKRNKICLLKDQVPEGQGTKKQKPGHSGTTVHLGQPGFSSNINSTSSLLFPIGDPASPSLLLAGLLGGCAVTASIVFLTFFICLRRKLLKLTHHDPSGSGSSCSGGSCTNSCTNTTGGGHHGDPSSSNNSSPACLLRQVQCDSNSNCHNHHHHHQHGGGHVHNNMTNSSNLTTKWLTPAGLLGSNFTNTATANSTKTSCGGGGTNPTKDNKFLVGTNIITNPVGNCPNSSSLVSRSSGTGSPNSYVTIASFWNDIFAPGGGSGSNIGNYGIGHQKSSSNCHRASKVSSNNSNNMMNSSSTFRNTSGGGGCNSSSNMTKGSDVSPYAYAQIISLPPPPPTAPPVPLIPSPKFGHQQQAPPLIEWYSQSPNLPGNNSPSGHIYSNHLYTFGNPPVSGQANTTPSGVGGSGGPNISNNSQVLTKSPKHPKEACGQGNPSTTGGGGEDHQDGNSSTLGRSTLGSESLIQIDGFQCRKNFSKETNVVERFL